MIHIGLFEGIGGFGLACRWAGVETAVTCEIDEFNKKILDYHFSEAYNHDDIYTLTKETIEDECKKRFGTDWRDEGVLITGGFPCQPWSSAGKKQGKQDDRHLWAEMLRVISEIRPDWIICENVDGLRTMVQPIDEADVEGDPSVSEQAVLGEYMLCNITQGIEALGYEVQTFCIPACAVNAPHRRYRLWIVARRIDAKIKHKPNDAPDTKSERVSGENNISSKAFEIIDGELNIGSCAGWNTSDTRRQICHETRGPMYDWSDWPSKHPICGRDDGIPRELDSVSFPYWRKKTIMAYGNAVVPQIAYRIIMAIIETDGKWV